MFRNCNGFILAEHLLALSVWLLISLTFVPIYIHLQKQYEKSEENKQVTAIFYQYLIDLQLGEGEKNISTLENKGKRYSVRWNENGRVCIYYEDVFRNKEEICEYIPSEQLSKR